MLQMVGTVSHRLGSRFARREISVPYLKLLSGAINW